MYLEHIGECRLRYIHKTEKRFALREERSVTCERIPEYSSDCTFPITLVDHYDYFTSLTGYVRH